MCVCMCETNGVGLHARSGKRCLLVVRSSWAEEKPPKTTTTIGSVQRGYTYIYILLLFTCLLHRHIYSIIYRYSYIVHVAPIMYIIQGVCVFFFSRPTRTDIRAFVLSLLLFFSARTNSLPVFYIIIYYTVFAIETLAIRDRRAVSVLNRVYCFIII